MNPSKQECVHKKEYDMTISYPTNPPKYQWACELCGETGLDTGFVSTHKGVEVIDYEKFKKAVNEIELLMLQISVRKFEKADKYRRENSGKADLTDLDWCFEQLYWLKKQFN